MNQFSLNPFMFEEFKRQHEELVKNSILLQKVKEINEGEDFTNRDKINIIALLGKELSRIGFSLEMRYGGQPEARTMINQPGNQGGCA